MSMFDKHWESLWLTMTDNFIADAVPANIAVLHKSWPFITDFNEFTGAHHVPSIPG